MRELSELIDGDDPAWPVLQEEFATTSVPLKVLPGDPDQGRSCLLQLQVSVESYLGALALASAGDGIRHVGDSVPFCLSPGTRSVSSPPLPTTGTARPSGKLKSCTRPT
ncbi:DUF2625 family protein [Nonomuraea sp. NPDC026600]|uniref:DUF2625 family protein n=1 Tax=Nonomuraea sp. NPDC026600 TaxID=3155363 RepID=UPI0033E6FC99